MRVRANRLALLAVAARDGARLLVRLPFWGRGGGREAGDERRARVGSNGRLACEREWLVIAPILRARANSGVQGWVRWWSKCGGRSPSLAFPC